MLLLQEISRYEFAELFKVAKTEIIAIATAKIAKIDDI